MKTGVAPALLVGGCYTGRCERCTALRRAPTIRWSGACAWLCSHRFWTDLTAVAIPAGARQVGLTGRTPVNDLEQTSRERVPGINPVTVISDPMAPWVLANRTIPRWARSHALPCRLSGTVGTGTCL
ncbi:hypothetical protein GCM10023317_85400 [Actinopolymorpha pittospori]|uniref:Uncharacterized protein n=1 Tax=Actinopolymorpha pittospori TaxID=648752 RepID=A0A927MNY8_9ACTN|nr:hypothetical protein [Actinopolymorpha pittospori]